MIETIFYYKNNKKQYFFRFSKFITLIFVFGFSAELTIFMLYWVGVYPVQKVYGLELFKNANEHGGFLLVVWIDNFLNTIRFRPRHVFFLVIILLCYISVNLGVTLQRGYPVYPVLKYNDLESYGFIVAAIFVSISHFFGNIYFYNRIKLPRLQTSKQNEKYLEQSITDYELGVKSSQNNLL